MASECNYDIYVSSNVKDGMPVRFHGNKIVRAIKKNPIGTWAINKITGVSLLSNFNVEFIKEE